MQDNVFVDTNIWLYAFSDSSDDKGKISKSIIKKNNIYLNTQVLNEFCNILIKNAGYNDDEILHTVKNIYKKYDVVKIDEKTILGASILRKTYKLGFWDSLILSSAINYDCIILYSDLIDPGINIKEIKIINPYK